MNRDCPPRALIAGFRPACAAGYAKALSGRRNLPILRKPYQIAALSDAIRQQLDARAAKANGLAHK